MQTKITIKDKTEFQQRALQWAMQFPYVALFDSNNYALDKHSKIEWKLAIDALDFIAPNENYFEAVNAFKQKYPADFLAGFFRYECKNESVIASESSLSEVEVERAKVLSFGKDLGAGFPPAFFFRPRYILSFVGNELLVNRNYPETFELLEQINQYKAVEKMRCIELTEMSTIVHFTEQTPKEKYLQNVEHIRSRIAEGDFYEMNYCTEIKAENAAINPAKVYAALQKKTEAPFACFVKYGEQYLLCASPERFLAKRGSKIISQPIKGTIRKGNTDEENERLKNELLNSEKERAENVMIVDLVRNDLTKFAKTGTINVDELFGVYSFKTVHHLISTISAELQDEDNAILAIKNAFPMGSMTGAPKHEVIKQIDEIEDMQRGLFSGAVGYFDEANDFDFNVVIRSIFYNADTKEISIKTGGAITYDSVAEKEYEETILKRKAMEESLQQIKSPFDDFKTYYV